MQIALEQAHAAEQRGEVPIGAVIADKHGTIIARAGNETRALNDPTAHAEILAIRRACQALNVERLVGCVLYVTLEPCNMCATAISFARIEKLYYAAEDAKGGAVDNGTRFYHSQICHHAPEVVGGIEEVAAAKILTDFFAKIRQTPNQRK